MSSKLQKNPQDFVLITNPLDRELSWQYDAITYTVPAGSKKAPAQEVFPGVVGRHIFRHLNKPINAGITIEPYDYRTGGKKPVGIEVQNCPFCDFQSTDFAEFVAHVATHAAPPADSKSDEKKTE